MQTLLSNLDKINDFIGRSVSWLALCMVLMTTLVVILRYGFNLGWIAMQESINYMHSLLFLLGIAYTLQHDAHVRVDIFYRKYSPKTKAIINILGTLFFLFPVALFIAWISWEYVASSWEFHESSPETGGLAGVFLIKSLLLILPFLLFLQGIAELLRNILQLHSSSFDNQHSSIT